MPPYQTPSYQKAPPQIDRATLQQLLARQNAAAPKLSAGDVDDFLLTNANQAIGTVGAPRLGAADAFLFTNANQAVGVAADPSMRPELPPLQITQADLDAIAAADRPRDLPSPKSPVAYRAPRSRYEDEAEDALVKFRYTTPDDWQGRAALGAMAQAAQARAMEEQEMWRSRLVQDAMAGIVPAVSPDQLETITLADGKTYIADPYTGDWMGVEGAPAEAAQRIATEAHARETERAGKLRDTLIAMQAGGASAKVDAEAQLQRQKAQADLLTTILTEAGRVARERATNAASMGDPLTADEMIEDYRQTANALIAAYGQELVTSDMVAALPAFGAEEAIGDEMRRRQEFVRTLTDMKIGFRTKEEWQKAYEILKGKPLSKDRDQIRRHLAKEKMSGNYGLGNWFWGGWGDDEEKQYDSTVAAQSWIDSIVSKRKKASPVTFADAAVQGAVPPADAAITNAPTPEEFAAALAAASQVAGP